MKLGMNTTNYLFCYTYSVEEMFQCIFSFILTKCLEWLTILNLNQESLLFVQLSSTVALVKADVLIGAIYVPYAPT